MAKIGDVTIQAYRVLRAYGPWEVGDVIRTHPRVGMSQGIRVGMVERAPEFDQIIPLTTVFADGKVEVKVEKPRARKKAEPVEEPDDGSPTV